MGRAVLGWAVMAALAACGPAAEQSETEALPAPARAVLVSVANHNWSDINVYLVSGAQRVRLGTVTSMGKHTFVVPGQLISGNARLRLLADPIGSDRRFLTEPVLVTHGQRVELRLENNLSLSSYVVW